MQWHLGYACWGYTPTFRGYSSYYGFYSGGQDYFMHGQKGSLDFHLEVGERCGDNCTLPQWDAVGTYSTTLFTSQRLSPGPFNYLQAPHSDSTVRPVTARDRP